MECYYIPVLLWKRVLVSWCYILKTAIARHSNLIPFDSKWATSYLAIIQFLCLNSIIYELLDNLSYWSHLVICRISRKPLNLDTEIVL